MALPRCRDSCKCHISKKEKRTVTQAKSLFVGGNGGREGVGGWGLGNFTQEIFVVGVS